MALSGSLPIVIGSDASFHRLLPCPRRHPSRLQATSESEAPVARSSHWVKGVKETRNSIVSFIQNRTFSALISRFQKQDLSLEDEDVVQEMLPAELGNIDVYNFPPSQCLEHPTIRLMIDRKLDGSYPGQRQDGYKLGLVVEGGGMRGAVSGAMGMELVQLGLLDVFDGIYGSSAGAVNGTYFLTGQQDGMDIYFDHLANNRFIDFKRLFGPDPVLDLDYLLDIMEEVIPLKWNTVLNSEIPLKIIASSLDAMSSVTLGPFDQKDDLVTALKASCTVPEIVGPPEVMHGHRLVDAAVFEPIPYKAAIQDGCTHVLTLCSRPRPKGGIGRVRKTMKHILDKAIKQWVLSPPYMEGAWKVEVEEMLKAGGIDADDLMLLTMMQGLQGMQPTPIDGHVFAIYPTLKHIIPPTCIDGELLKTAAGDARAAVRGLFEPLANDPPNKIHWLFI